MYNTGRVRHTYDYVYKQQCWLTVHFQCIEERTEGLCSPCCSRFSRGVGSLNKGPSPSSGVGRGRVRGIISLMVSTGAAGTASVEAVKEKSSQDIQKPP